MYFLNCINVIFLFIIPCCKILKMLPLGEVDKVYKGFFVHYFLKLCMNDLQIKNLN